MNEKIYKETIKDLVPRRFKNKKAIKSKVVWRYPRNLENEYRAVIEGYLRLCQKDLKRYQRGLESSLKGHLGGSETARLDSDRTEFLYTDDLKAFLVELFEKEAAKYFLLQKVSQLGNIALKMEVREWQRVVRRTLGLDIFEDYYLGNFYKENMSAWIADNVSLIKSIPNDQLIKMENIVYKAFKEGRAIPDIVDVIQQSFNVTLSKAKLLARDQMGKLSGEITMAQQMDAGVTEYIWSTSKDQRVRDSHRRLEGKAFEWSNPPIVDMKTGRRCHPGQDYQCRCVALPIFDLEKLSLPVKGIEKGVNKYV